MIHHTIYRHSESSEWVAFLHGAGGSSSIWYRQLREFRKKFNVLLLDLPGHGNCLSQESPYSFEGLAEDVIDVLIHRGILGVHLVGVSLGTIVARLVAEIRPQTVRTLILTGAITHLNRRARILMNAGNVLRRVVPYLWLYRFFAWVIMPGKNHLRARRIFTREARKLSPMEFQKWYDLSRDVERLLIRLESVENQIPSLFLMGNQDHMFLPHVRLMVRKQFNCELRVVESGHVCNIEQSKLFNEITVQFIQRHSKEEEATAALERADCDLEEVIC